MHHVFENVLLIKCENVQEMIRPYLFIFFLHCALKEQYFVVTFKIFVPFSVIFFVLAVKYTMTIRPVVSLYFCINKVSPKELLAENLACLSMVCSLSLIFDNRVGGCYHSVCP